MSNETYLQVFIAGVILLIPPYFLIGLVTVSIYKFIKSKKEE